MMNLQIFKKLSSLKIAPKRQWIYLSSLCGLMAVALVAFQNFGPVDGTYPSAADFQNASQALDSLRQGVLAPTTTTFNGLTLPGRALTVNVMKCPNHTDWEGHIYVNKDLANMPTGAVDIGSIYTIVDGFFNYALYWTSQCLGAGVYAGPNLPIGSPAMPPLEALANAAIEIQYWQDGKLINAIGGGFYYYWVNPNPNGCGSLPPGSVCQQNFAVILPPPPQVAAYTNSRVMGSLDSVLLTTQGEVFLQGWACQSGRSSPINVAIYSGAPKDQGGQLITTVGTVPTPSDAVTDVACGALGSHVFAARLNSTYNRTGQKFYVYGLSNLNTGDVLLPGSGAGVGIALGSLCAPGITQLCTGSNGSGLQTCDAFGSAWGTCSLTSCNPGYYSSAGSCLAQVCSPNSTAACTGTNGSGTKTCAANGSAWGSCVLNTCNLGYTLSGGACVSNSCTPNTTASCTGTNGSGTKTCSFYGTWGTCTLTTCNAGYTLSAGSCVASTQSCTFNTTAPCTGTNGSGTKTCALNGTWGACTLTTCNAGYTLSGGSCVASTQTCTPNSTASCTGTNGSGTKTCNSSGTGWSACTLTTCNTGYTLSGGSCVSSTQVCAPNSTAACTGTNGSGTKTCNSTGSGWSACTLTSCNTGYVLLAGTCYKF